MKKSILLVLITAIVFTGIGAFAAIEYQADEIGYGNGTVKDAIDDLYTKTNKDLIFGTKLNAYNIGDRTVNRSNSLQLSKGKYIVYLVNADTYTESSKNDSVYYSGNSINLQCNSCEKQMISQDGFNIKATAAIKANTFLANVVHIKAYYVEITADTDILSFTNVSGADPGLDILTLGISISAIPIS